MHLSNDVGVQWFEIYTDANGAILLGATTIPAHQGVGMSTGEITPSASIRSSSALTCGRRGSGI